MEMEDQILVRSWTRVLRRFARGVVPRWSRITKKRSDLRLDLCGLLASRRVTHAQGDLLLVFKEEL